MAVIALTQGYLAEVDDIDFERLNQWKWHAFRCASGHVYAARNSRPDASGRRTHIFMHRDIMGTPVGYDTDHADGDGLNNRRANLRIATRSQNMWNRKPNTRGRSAYKGVSWHKQHRKWIAAIQVDRKRKHLGLFDNEHEAGIAYLAAARNLHPDFHRTNS